MPDKPAYPELLQSLVRSGFHRFGEILDADSASALHRSALEGRAFGPELFLSEQEYSESPQHFGVNPRPGRNHLETFPDLLGFIEREPYLSSILGSLLGAGYWVHNKKFVCGVPDAWLPDYLARKKREAAINNLGAYVRPELRDITYFNGIDFHQDVVDWPAWPEPLRTAEFVTLYVYLHDVTLADSPLYVLPGTHVLGASHFPHELERRGDTSSWTYRDGRGRSLAAEHQVLTGGTGYAALWHSCLLHGTPAISTATNMRLSVRYLLARSRRRQDAAGLDAVNARVEGPLTLANARRDLDADGKVVSNQNNLAKQR